MFLFVLCFNTALSFVYEMCYINKLALFNGVSISSQVVLQNFCIKKNVTFFFISKMFSCFFYGEILISGYFYFRCLLKYVYMFSFSHTVHWCSTVFTLTLKCSDIVYPLPKSPVFSDCSATKGRAITTCSVSSQLSLCYFSFQQAGR